MGCSLVRASEEVGLATWKVAQDGTSLDLKVSKGGLWTPQHDAMRPVAIQASCAE